MTFLVLVFWISFSSDTSIYSKNGKFCWNVPVENSDHVVVLVSIDFPVDSKQDVPFHCIAYAYSIADRDGLHDHLRDVPMEDIFNPI